MVKTSINNFLELIRFSHTVFALPFALLAAILAWSQPGTQFRWRDALGIVLCMVFARSAAMAFNRLVDRHIDAANPRTADRHLPAGKMSVRTVAFMTLACSVCFVASCLLFLPRRLPLLLSVPVLLFLFGYSYAKRWTALCHYWLSAALMMSPVAAWIAVRDEITLVPVLLGGVIFFWVGGFDIIYACQDAEFDRQQGLRSIPARVGVAAALRLAMLSHILTVVMLFLLWYVAEMGPVFLAGIVFISIILLYQHTLVRPDDLRRINVAFFNVNAVVSFGILAAGCLDVWLRQFQ